MQRFDFVYADHVGCPLGRIVHAKIKWDSQGVGGQRLRVNRMHLLVYTIEGEARYADANSRRRVMRPGDLLLLPAGIPQVYGPAPGRRWSELFMWLTGPLFDMWFAGGLINPLRPFYLAENVDYWTGRFVEIGKEPESQRPETSMFRLGRLQQVIAEILLLRHQQGRTREERIWLETAQNRLDTERLDDPPLPEISHSMHMSYETFRKKFARLAGIPPASYRARQVIRRACDLIVSQSLPLKDIARRQGFTDQFHFSRRFKAVMGFPPSDLPR